MIDLRSDTITKPTPAMLEAMVAAEVGDDVLGDDPTVHALEARTSEILGKEAAVFVPSGTMANEVAVRSHTEPGDEIYLHEHAHIHLYEAGGPAVLSGVTVRLLEGERGIFSAERLARSIRPADEHFPHPRLVCLENTHNRGGGSIWSLEGIRAVTELARERGLATHLDGARLWNASVATGIAERTWAEPFDSVSVCFSKGLGAPVGSALAGSAAFVERARRFRKLFGGGMRQAGYLAAAALYALEHHRARLAEDHANAKALAGGIADVPGIEIDLEAVETNIAYFRVSAMPAQELVERLKEKRVLVLATGPDTIRFVCSLAVTRDRVDEAASAIRTALE